MEENGKRTTSATVPVNDRIAVATGFLGENMNNKEKQRYCIR
jgi:hypothetical protein